MAISSVITNKGRAMFADRLRPTPSVYGAAPRYLAMGVGATGAGHTATATDVALINEVESRVVGTDTVITTSVTGDTFQLSGTMTANGGARAVDEAGIFDAAFGGNMFSSATFNVINLNQLDSIIFTWRVQLA